MYLKIRLITVQCVVVGACKYWHTLLTKKRDQVESESSIEGHLQCSLIMGGPIFSVSKVVDDELDGDVDEYGGR
jgi:hypothetical protein